MDMAGLVFWLVIALIALSVIWASHLNRREVERTIRLAIERGVPLDADTIRRLKSRPERAPIYLLVSGIILFALALGVIVFAFVAEPEDPETFLPLLGIAALIGFPALGLGGCGVWLMRRARLEQGT